MIRRDTLKNRAIEVAVIAIVAYLVAFYVFDLPSWLKLAAGIGLGAAWLYVFLVHPTIRTVKRKRFGEHS